MVARRNLHASGSERIARLISGAAQPGKQLTTRPSGVKHLGQGGDIVWTGPRMVTNPDDPTGPLIPDPAATWSVREVPQIVETLTERLDTISIDVGQLEDGLAEVIESATGSALVVAYRPPTAADTTNPDTSKPYTAGDTWRQWDNAQDRRLQGFWVWRNGGWESETLSDAMFDRVDISKLVALSGAINNLVAETIAAKQLEVGAIRSIVDADGLYTTFESTGIEVWDNDGVNDIGQPEIQTVLGRMVRVGSGQNYASMDNTGLITAREMSTNSLIVGGQRFVPGAAEDDTKMVGYGIMYGGRSRRLQGRDLVLGVEVMLKRGRMYRLFTNSPIVETWAANVNPLLTLHYTLDGSYPGNNWGATQRGESTIGPYQGWNSLPALEAVPIDLRGQSGPDVWCRIAVALVDKNNAGVSDVAATVNPLLVWVQDVGSRIVNTGTPFFNTGGGGQIPPKVSYSKIYPVREWRTYTRGGGQVSNPSNKPQQGNGGSQLRTCYMFFDDMSPDLNHAGVEIESIECFTIADHWYNGVGTAHWHWHPHHRGQIPAEDRTLQSMTLTPGWPAGQRRSIKIIREEFEAWRTGARRGFGFAVSSSDREYYGLFSPLVNDNTTVIEVRWKR